MKQGEFITYADGKDKRVQFKLTVIQRELPENNKKFFKTDLGVNFERIYEEPRSIFSLIKFIFRIKTQYRSFCYIGSKVLN